MIETDSKRKIYEQLDIIKSCSAMESNQLIFSDYLISFAMSATDDEQHFNQQWPKECLICHCLYFNHGFKFQDCVWNGCHNLTMLCLNISDIPFISVKNVDYC